MHHEQEPTEKSPPTTVLLLPSFIIVDNVVPSNAGDLIAKYISTGPTNTQPLKKTDEPEAPAVENKPAAEPTESVEPVKAGEAATGLNGPNTASAEGTASPPDLSKLTISPSQGTHSTTSFTARLPLSSRPCPHKYLILLCSHKTRDARCGQSAPLLAKEFARVLRPLGLHRDLHDERPGGVGVYFINHVGGHKYSANVIIYRKGENGMFSFIFSLKIDLFLFTFCWLSSANWRFAWCAGEAVQGIWLARVRPEDCENVIKYTVLQGKVVKPERQLRGGFNRETGMVSW